MLPELEVLVPLELVPCQYQVIPEGGVPRDSTLLPQLLVTVGAEGVAGDVFTVTETERTELQHPLLLFLALK